ncbi:MAG: Ribonuclease HII [Firmicutes bacterium ADurb.Bin193]|nr:MAG: Ribonuclease HII [Firmicutes bacterium ADurb.Bin193]
MSDFERVDALWRIEREKMRNGYTRIAGVDEAGRGPLAGPVCVAAVILPPDAYLEGIDDSKKLSEKNKNRLFDEIRKVAVCYNIVLIHNDEIDRLNILGATFKGMCESVNGLSEKPDFVLVDGNMVRGMSIPHECIVKGDSKSISIAAASILAKVTRDRYMDSLGEEYAVYGFKKHKGYPTKAHYEALSKYGASDIHRKSFNLKIGIGG